MKKIFSYFSVMMLALAIVMTSCGQQEQTEKEVPLKVTYNIECSGQLLDLCDLVVTYKGEDGVNVVDTITATPNDTVPVKDWTKEIQTHKIPVKIGLNYTLVQKTDTLIIDQKLAQLKAKCTIIADKMGMVNRSRSLSDKTINKKKSFYVEVDLINEEVINTRQNLADAIKLYNDLQAYTRESGRSNTCFIIKSFPNSSSLMVREAPWNDEETK